MSTLTLNYRFTLPNYRLTGWDTAVNNNFIAIDALLGQFNTGLNLQGLWTNSTLYTAGVSVVDGLTGNIWVAGVTHTSNAASTFAADRTANPTWWTNVTNPAISAQQSAINAAASAASVNMNNTGRNLIMNGQFNVLQRGVGPWSAAGWTADRWAIATGTGGGSRSVSVGVASDAFRTQLNDESMNSYLTYAATGGTGAGDFDFFSQAIENVRLLAGKTVTVSFWALAAAGTPKVAIELAQVFGTGGAPSASVLSIGATPFTLSTGWARYTATVIIPTIVGKTLGTNPDNATFLNFWFSSGTTNNVTRASSIGVQTATISLWDVKVEIGSTATVIEKRPYSVELALCERYYEVVRVNIRGSITAGTNLNGTAYYKVDKRTTPTVTILTPGIATNVLSTTITPFSDSARFEITANATGDTYIINYMYAVEAGL